MDFLDQLNIVDYIILTLALVSILIGLWRGFIVEFASILPWVGAAAITFYGTPFLLPHFYKLLSPSFLTEAIAMISIFIVSCLFLSILRPGLKEKVRDSSLSGLDRFLGLIFGSIRAAFLYGALYVLTLALTPYETWPQAIQNASTMPFINGVAHILARFLPPTTQANIKFPDGNNPIVTEAQQSEQTE